MIVAPTISQVALWEYNCGDIAIKQRHEMEGVYRTVEIKDDILSVFIADPDGCRPILEYHLLWCSVFALTDFGVGR